MPEEALHLSSHPVIINNIFNNIFNNAINNIFNNIFTSSCLRMLSTSVVTMS